MKAKAAKAETMNYFKAITHECEKLDVLGQAYLDRFDFIPSNEIAERIWRKACELFDKNNKNWDLVPEWAANVLDNGVPYCDPPQNGSLFYSLGYSIVARDAHLRNLLEIAEGRETEELSFGVVADKKNVDKLAGL